MTQQNPSLSIPNLGGWLREESLLLCLESEFGRGYDKLKLNFNWFGSARGFYGECNKGGRDILRGNWRSFPKNKNTGSKPFCISKIKVGFSIVFPFRKRKTKDLNPKLSDLGFIFSDFIIGARNSWQESGYCRMGQFGKDYVGYFWDKFGP